MSEIPKECVDLATLTVANYFALDEPLTKAACIKDVAAALDACSQEAREKVAAWMIEHSFATGHGDTLDDLLKELSWQVQTARIRSGAAHWNN